MTLEEACSLVQDVSEIPFHILHTMAECEAFCRKYQFHSRQDYLEPFVMEIMMDELGETEVVCSIDLFQIRFAFCRCADGALVVGPYCTESFSESDCRLLFKRKGLSGIEPKELMCYREKFRVVSENYPLHLLRCIAKNTNWEGTPNQIRHVDFDGMVRSAEPEKVWIPHSQEVSERYQVEAAFMASICRGDHIAAIAQWRDLHNRMEGYKRMLGSSVQLARNSAAITRSIIRVAASQAGIPPVVNDQVSGKSAAIIHEASTIDEIDQEHERLIREYCRLIRRQQRDSYSGLIQTVIYFIEKNYFRDISVERIARELEISASHLIQKFRAETGQTPYQYLQNYRMHRAAQALLAGNDSVQDISNAVGIADANYFSRLFKQTFGVTPTQYRKQRRQS